MTKEMEAAWVNAIHTLKFREADDGVREIARLLREGEVDDWALNAPAKMIDPDFPHTINGVKLAIQRSSGKGAPPRRQKYDPELTDWLVHMIDVYGEKTDAVYATAKDRFDVSRRHCIDALNHARENRDEAFFEDYKQKVLRLREQGAEGLPGW